MLEHLQRGISFQFSGSCGYSNGLKRSLSRRYNGRQGLAPYDLLIKGTDLVGSVVRARCEQSE